MKITLWRDDATIRARRRRGGRASRRARAPLLGVEHGGTIGFGEVGAQPSALNGDPSLDDVIDEVRASLLLVPHLRADPRSARSTLPSWTRRGALRGSRAASRFAVGAGRDGAAGPANCDRAARRSAALWPSSFDTPVHGDGLAARRRRRGPSLRAPRVCGPRLGRGRSAATRCDDCASSGCRCCSTSTASADALDDVIDQVRLVARVADVVGRRAALRAWATSSSPRRLAERLDVPVSLDEGVRSVADVEPDRCATRAADRSASSRRASADWPTRAP